MVAVSVLMWWIGPARAGLTPAQKCANAKLNATATKASTALHCYEKTDPAKRSACLSKVQQKLNDAFAKAEGKGGCATTGDASNVQNAVDTLVTDVAGSLLQLPPPTLCCYMHAGSNGLGIGADACFDAVPAAAATRCGGAFAQLLVGNAFCNAGPNNAAASCTPMTKTTGSFCCDVPDFGLGPTCFEYSDPAANDSCTSTTNGFGGTVKSGVPCGPLSGTCGGN